MGYASMFCLIFLYACRCTVGQRAKYLSIVTKGIATFAGSGLKRLLREGDHCGEEMIMSDSVYAITVRTLTYVHAQRLTRNDMFDCLAENPKRFATTSLLVRTSSIKMALRLCMLSAYKLHIAELGIQPLTRLEREEYKSHLHINARNKSVRREKARGPKDIKKEMAIKVRRCSVANALQKNKDPHARELEILAQHTTPKLAQWFRKRAQKGPASVVADMVRSNRKKKASVEGQIEILNARTERIEKLLLSLCSDKGLINHRNLPPLIAKDTEHVLCAVGGNMTQAIESRKAVSEDKSAGGSGDLRQEYSPAKVEVIFHNKSGAKVQLLWDDGQNGGCAAR